MSTTTSSALNFPKPEEIVSAINESTHHHSSALDDQSIIKSALSPSNNFLPIHHHHHHQQQFSATPAAATINKPQTMHQTITGTATVVSSSNSNSFVVSRQK